MILSSFNGLLTVLATQCLTKRRARHTKCDEEKPSCMKCRKTGRICDGYISQDVKESAAFVPSQLYEKVLRPCNALVAGSALSTLSSTGERQHFEYFQHCSMQQINLAFSTSTAAHQLILQLSHSNISVIHIVVALGSLTRCMEERKNSSTRSAPRLKDSDEQYVKAIQQLRKDMEVSIITLIPQLLFLNDWTRLLSLPFDGSSTGSRLLFRNGG